MLQMQRYLSPGYKVKHEEEAKPKGRPPVKAAEGALDLGEKRPRACASRKKEFEKRLIRELRRSVEVLPTLSSFWKAKQKLRTTFLWRIAQSKARAKAKEQAKAKAQA